MTGQATDRRVLLTWLLLVVLSVASYRLVDGGGSAALLFGVVFVKLERIWSVYLEVGRGPRWLQRLVMVATALLVLVLGLVAA